MGRQWKPGDGQSAGLSWVRQPGHQSGSNCEHKGFFCGRLTEATTGRTVKSSDTAIHPADQENERLRIWTIMQEGKNYAALKKALQPGPRCPGRKWEGVSEGG